MSQSIYFRILSREAPGVVGVPARLALTVLSWPYSAIVRVRNHLYSTGRLKVHRAGVPVICVGNLTTGGTGKTPLVSWLCRYVAQKGCRAATLTRGYKTRQGEISDEPALLAAQCPNVPVVVNPDRVAGAARAIRDHRAQVLVMDDGFQHRRLARDLDIVAIDATQPFGPGGTGILPVKTGWQRPYHGRLLPAGLLREPVTGLRRAHAVVLTRCDQVPPENLEQVEEDLRGINPDLVLARAVHAPMGIRTRVGTQIALDQVRGQQVFAFCGIGNPASFFRTVEHLGGILAGSRAYADHHRYEAADLAQIRRQAAERQASLVLTTQKDWTKVVPLADPQEQPALAYLVIELRVIAGAERLTALIDRLLGGIMPTRQTPASNG